MCILLLKKYIFVFITILKLCIFINQKLRKNLIRFLIIINLNLLLINSLSSLCHIVHNPWVFVKQNNIYSP